MNPQNVGPPQQFIPQQMPDQSSPYVPPSPNVYNGLNNQPGATPEYGMPFNGKPLPYQNYDVSSTYSQNGLMPQGQQQSSHTGTLIQKPIVTGVSEQQFSYHSPAPLVSDQITRQVGELSIGPSNLQRPPSSVAASQGLSCSQRQGIGGLQPSFAVGPPPPRQIIPGPSHRFPATLASQHTPLSGSSAITSYNYSAQYGQPPRSYAPPPNPVVSGTPLQLPSTQYSPLVGVGQPVGPGVSHSSSMPVQPQSTQYHPIPGSGTSVPPSSGAHPQYPPFSGTGQPLGSGVSPIQPQQGVYHGAHLPVASQPLTSISTLPPSSQVNGPVSGAPLTSGLPSVQSRYPYTQASQQQPAAMQAQYPPVAPGMPQNRMGAPVAPQQPRRLDPDQMPSPIQVIEDDRKQRSGTFYTNTKGQVPPLVTTDFLVHDEGNCSPRFVRSTIYSVPTTSEMLKQAAVPFAITISAFAKLKDGEQSPPVSNPGETGPVRCIRCKAYMCPFMQFIDGGRRFQCIFCKGTTEVPPEYFSHLDHMGQRIDKFQRPELCLGSYEYLTTKDYCKNGVLPKPPAFIFMIDVSYNSIRNGMVKLLCENMKEVLTFLPKEVGAPASVVKVGFVTYSNVVHFYNVKGNLAQPQMLVVPDVQEMFVPLLDGFLVSAEEAESVIDSLMEQIPQMFMATRETETILGPVIQAGLEALKTAECAGKVLIFHTTLPIADAPGKLKNRDDRKLLGTDKEKTTLVPQSTFYNNLGQECVTSGCCVDLFLFPNSYIDIATVGQVCRLSGGHVHKYTYFQADVDGRRFLEDLKHSLQITVAFDAIMRVRTSTGIRPTDFYGHYYMSNTTDVELAAVDEDKSVSVEIKYDDKLTEEDGAYIQVAVLFTSCGGQRRLRIHNLALETCNQMAVLYRNCELDTIMNYFSKLGLRMILEQTPRQMKDYFINRSAQILASYRKHCASPSSAGQLILPECMKLLPLYINCLTKSDALSGGPDMSTDDRSFGMLAVATMDVARSTGYLYPRLLPLHDVDPDSTDFPKAVRCSVEKIKDNGVYLLENGIHMFLWIGMAVNPDWLQNVFGVQTAARVDIDKTSLLELNTPLSLRIRDIVETVREERQKCMRLTIVRQGDKLELVFRQYLVEDRGSDGSASYVDFLCHLHKEIRSLLS